MARGPGDGEDGWALGPLEPIVPAEPRRGGRNTRPKAHSPKTPRKEPKGMRISLGGVLLLALAAGAIAFAAAPWFAFRSFRDAARTADVEALAELVDYPAVRADLAAQLSGLPMPSTPRPTLWTNPIGALKDAFTAKPPEPPRVERYISPAGLTALADGVTPGANLPPADKEPFPMVAFWGPSRCRITVADPAAPDRKTGFTFTRRGVFDWKLARIELPGGKAKAASSDEDAKK